MASFAKSLRLMAQQQINPSANVYVPLPLRVFPTSNLTQVKVPARLRCSAEQLSMALPAYSISVRQAGSFEDHIRQ